MDDHTWNLEREPIEVAPTDGWPNFELGTTARFTCSCGVDTGHGDSQAVLDTGRQHLRLLGVPV